MRLVRLVRCFLRAEIFHIVGSMISVAIYRLMSTVQSLFAVVNEDIVDTREDGTSSGTLFHSGHVIVRTMFIANGLRDGSMLRLS